MTTTDVYVVYLNRYKIIYDLGGWMVGLVGLLNGWVYVVVLTFTHRYNAVRGHSTGSNTLQRKVTSGQTKKRAVAKPRCTLLEYGQSKVKGRNEAQTSTTEAE